MPELSYIRKSIEDVMYTPDLPSIAKIQEELKPHIADVSEVLRRYTDLVDAYYEHKKPFASKDEVQDLAEIIQIIGFSTIIGNYFLIEKWCVQHFQRSEPAKPLAYYIAKMEELHNDPNSFGFSIEAQPYTKYLINQWKK